MSRQVTRRVIIALGSVVVVAGGAAMVLAADEPESAVAGGVTTTEAAPSTSTTTEPATTTSTTPTTTASTTSAMPTEYRYSVETVTLEQLGSSWRSGMGCPDPAGLRAVNLVHWGYDGAVHEGRIIVAADQAENVAAIFGDLYAARFPIERMEPVDRYGGDDQASMRANNTSGFNCRTVAGTSSLSRHGLGLAIDVNPLHNPYVKRGSVDPPEGEPWADRSRRDPGMIHADDSVVRAFAARGWSWGGYWSSGQDYQHFSA